MPDSSPTSLMMCEGDFDQLCHDLKNPLMVIRGRAQLVERAIQRTTELPDAERVRILNSLAVLDDAVVRIVEMIDDSDPTCLAGEAGRKPSRIDAHSS
jgi:nitrogen-specific signal transduction histidine kinase